MPIKDFIAQFEYNPENFDMEKFKEKVLEEFGADEGVWTAKVSELEEASKKTANELLNTKARNWDLLKQIPGESDSKSGAPLPDADNTEVSIDDFFGDKKKE